jgi:hypothetical protein
MGKSAIFFQARTINHDFPVASKQDKIRDELKAEDRKNEKDWPPICSDEQSIQIISLNVRRLNSAI